MKHVSWAILMVCLVGAVYGHDGHGSSNTMRNRFGNPQSNYVGIGWSSSFFAHPEIRVIDSEGFLRYATTPTEQLHHFSLQGGWQVSSKWHLSAQLPYRINSVRVNQVSNEQQGIGDLTLTVNHQLLSTEDSTGSHRAHLFFLGGGIKLPTGQTESMPSGLNTDYSFLMASGSVDVLLSAQYEFRFGNAGLISNLQYRVNTTGSNSQRLPNSLQLGASVYYSIPVKNLVIRPGTGVDGFVAKSQLDIPAMEGRSTVQTFGQIQVIHPGFELAAGIQLPIYQELNQDTDPKLRHQFFLQWNYLF